MNNHSYLIEIGLEEMPAQYVRSISEQFQERVENFLDENRLSYGSIETFATPRRFAVLVKELADRQSTFEEEAKGPAKRIAQDEAGNWTKAAMGFARGKGLTIDDIYFKELKGEDYAYLTVRSEGLNVVEVLADIKNCVSEMNFPVSMHWDSHEFRYIRPVHWIVSLLDKEVIPFNVLAVEAGNLSRGHRFLHNESVEISHASLYEESLEKAAVIVDQDKRKQMIKEQIEALAKENNYQVPLDQDLLEEVTQIVEYPTAFVGDFDEKYLSLPAPVLITSMREHQRYFAVEDQEGKLLPHFIALRNGNHDHIETVKNGNEKVLVARLEDAMFFLEEDQKHTIDDFAQKLTDVTFHAEIGSMKQKMERTGKIAHYLYENWAMHEVFAGQLATDFTQEIDRTSAIYKFDLVTQIVDEFSELQGIIGEIYAKKAGEDPQVATAIREHYLPSGNASELPQSPLGLLFAISDKLESIISFFAIGKIPSGSNDPFALRRQMIGILAILEAEHLPLEWHQALKDIFDQVYDFDQNKQVELSQAIIQFLSDRLKNNLADKEIRFDISQAAREAKYIDVLTIIQSAELLNAHKEDEDYKDNVEAWQRINNIILKVSQEEVELPLVNEDLFESNSESDLYQAVSDLRLDEGVEEAYEEITALTPIITQFFEDNMVFTDNQDIRNNRLALLSLIDQAITKHYNVQALQAK
ncbi:MULTISPECIES: glycine--tRNA ligase subunit beta [Aerococcus]|uniref:glycine--tRNA ligase subunit beta n=1 Tax=Aerococcus urinae (strain CCUG 59500 / ACS-120-V-Col10a) TaxID=2976812 RepID=UPI000200E738|nr:glycine--tRNA ligase subunit beta [Aerococcus sp. Group 1]AEA01760.1 glycine--tRNA ligase, beta subunit [Aerococcus sp. Group 1]MCY3030449.1 glycine--tRNA ligase subunit beta [Aerococcus sp. Group 1]MCY3054491.1 glycine--tRNA ligase subunit beta [Aerococcus sp. Group 1]MCY3056221.1 glycine--tRNA ligase subunit beta [Aerococcus sp. Group 1]MCY3061679.1 glycine--tRNA ligase subunit beta [Aerococcus sp. Group 1]